MSTKEQAQAINKAIPTWVGVEPAQRARLVIDWCAKSGVACPLTAVALAAGMTKFPYFSQGPDNYLDFVQAFGTACDAGLSQLIPIVGITQTDNGPTR